MISRLLQTRFAALAAVLALISGSWAWYASESSGSAMTQVAGEFLGQLDAEQKGAAQLPYDDDRRIDWHFIPKEERKGVQIKHMTQGQREAAHKLLKTALSESGYDKTTAIMRLEQLLNELEQGRGRFARDWERYYFTVFGEPQETGRWGLSVEGHHLSLNFVVEDGRVISSTPQVLCANPAVVRTENKAGFALGTRVLAEEEILGFELVNDLSEEQRKSAIIAEKALSEIRDAGKPQPPTEAPAGIAAGELNESQQKVLRQLITTYTRTMPEDVARERWEAISREGFEKVHFAWAGALKPGIGHYYRIQGPTFLIEFVNTQPDAAGNPANHIHSIWRDMRGDFAIALKE